MQEDDEVVREFLIESRDNLDQLDRELVALEEDPHSQSRLSSVFRTIHTIKGTAGFFNFKKLEAVAHVGETLLSRLRDGVLGSGAERGVAESYDVLSALLADAVAEGR